MRKIHNTWQPPQPAGCQLWLGPPVPANASTQLPSHQRGQHEPQMLVNTAPAARPGPDGGRVSAYAIYFDSLYCCLKLPSWHRNLAACARHRAHHSSNNHAGTRGSGTVGNVLSKFLCSHYSRVPCSARRMAEKFCQGKKIVAVHENEAGGGKRDGLPVCVQHGSGPQAF